VAADPQDRFPEVVGPDRLTVGCASMADVARLGAGIPLVARRTEMRTLREALRRAAGGEAVGLLVSGDAGVGKSRLTDELVALAGAEGYVVLTGRCLDTAEAALPYLPFAEVTRGLADHDAQLIDDHVALRRLLPEPHPHADSTGQDRDLGQLQMFDALFAVLGEAASRRPVVVVIEDLHWADKSSRDLLAFLLARLSRQRLLLVGTLRSDDLHRRHPLRPLLAELVRLPAVERLHVEPFTPGDAETYVRTLADDSLPDDVVHRIAARSEGNAFMAEELVSASSDQVPQELAEVLLARFESLTPATQQVMRLASVPGRRFTHERLSAASVVAPAELDEALREAVAHNVLVTEGPAEAYAFRHALLREAVYADLLPGERSRLHAEAARALAGDTAQGAAAALAHHSMESHDLPGALAASVLAAREADEIGAPAEMLVHTERALQLWCAVDSAEQVSGADELVLTRWAARAAAASGEPDRAIAHSRSAIELVDRRGDALESADVRRRYAHYLLTLDGYEQRAYDTSYEAWQLVADREPSATKAWTQASLARSSASLDRLDEAGELAEAAMAMAWAVPGAGPQTAAEADALITRTVCIDRKQGSLDRALELFSEAVDLAAKADARDVELRARFQRATSLMDEGLLNEALAEVDAAVERAAGIGLTWSAYGLELRVRQVIIRFMTGEWDGAEAAAELAGASVSGTVITRVSAAGLLVLVGRGRFDVADRRLERLGQRWRIDQQVMTLVGTCGAELECWRGRPAQAAEYVEQALDRLRRNDPWHLVALSLCALGVAAYADTADAARQAHDAPAEREAIAAGEVIAEHAAQTLARGRPDSREVGPEGRAWFARVQAETARLRGEHDPAIWRAVVDAFGYGETYRQAHARWRLAETVLSGPGEHDRDQVAQELRAAAQAAEAMGAVPLRQAVERLARRARIGLDGSRPEMSAGPLTPRESAVLSLVAAGRTNRQIGAELFISEKTVSVHLSRAMAKLGAGSRTEAVSTAFARGLLTPAVTAP
jgi:DNA-binding CsgD family transcriptional regulator/tetratricopeptide (TPR) repeat protein